VTVGTTKKSTDTRSLAWDLRKDLHVGDRGPEPICGCDVGSFPVGPIQQQLMTKGCDFDLK
jgi:hypothetical protein